MKLNKYTYSIIILLIFYASRKSSYFYAYCVFGIDDYKALSELTKTILVQSTGILLPLTMVLAFNKFSFSKVLSDLGLKTGFMTGILYAFLFASPMFLGNFFFSPLKTDFTLTEIFETSFWPGFNEELVFRSILIGQLFKRAKWGFIPAALVSSLYFAVGHLFQSHDLSSAISIFFATSLAGIGFAIIFIECSWNLWLIIFLHSFMNLHTVFFETGGSAALNVTGNVFRFITIGLAVFYTVKQIKKNGSILKGNLWVNRTC